METAIQTPHELMVLEPYPLDQNPAAVYIASLPSPHSRRNMRRYLDQIAALLTNGQADALTLNWGRLRYPHTAAIRAWLLDRYAPATVNGMLAALRGTLKAAWQLGQLRAEDYQRAIQLKPVKGETLPAGRDLTPGEVAALSAACTADPSPAGVRDAAILGILSTAGLRRAEVVSLALKDFDAETGKLTIRGGKGRKERTTYVASGALEALHDWILLRGSEPGPLFTPVNKGGRMSIRPMTSQAVYNLLRKRARQAQVSAFSPHDFRRTFVGDLLDRGVDIVTVQKLAGHANVNTTGRYDRRPEEVKRQAAARLHFPYQRRKN
jgi:integrase